MTKIADSFDSSLLANKAMLVALTIKAPGNTVQDKEATAELVQDRHAKDGAAKVNKTLYNKDAVGWFRKPATEARKALYELTAPWDEGNRIMMVANYHKLVQKIAVQESAFWAGADRFQAQQEELIRQARNDLGTLFREDDYLDQESLRAAFSFELKLSPVPLGSDWRVTVGEEDEARIKAEIEARVKANAVAATKDAWSRLLERLETLSTRLEAASKVGESGRRGKLYETLLTNLQEVVAAIPGLNVVGDPMLDSMAKRAAAMVDGITIEDLRDNQPLQRSLALTATSMAEAAKVQQASLDMDQFDRLGALVDAYRDEAEAEDEAA